jgi:hypothetical protein
MVVDSFHIPCQRVTSLFMTLQITENTGISINEGKWAWKYLPLEKGNSEKGLSQMSPSRLAYYTGTLPFRPHLQPLKIGEKGRFLLLLLYVCFICCVCCGTWVTLLHQIKLANKIIYLSEKCKIQWSYFFFSFYGIRIESWDSCMLGKHSTIVLYFQPSYLSCKRQGI